MGAGLAWEGESAVLDVELEMPVGHPGDYVALGAFNVCAKLFVCIF